MDRQHSSERREKKPIGGDLIIPVGALVFTLYYFSTILDSPWTAQVSAFVIGSILIALVVAFLVITCRSVMRQEAVWRFGELVAPVALIPKRLTLFALTLGYIVVIEWGGFTLTTFAFLCLAMVLLGNGRNKRFAVVLSAIFALGGYLLFIAAFETRFPAGPFERLVETLF
jgi:hypothetical protein